MRTALSPWNIRENSWISCLKGSSAHACAYAWRCGALSLNGKENHTKPRNFEAPADTLHRDDFLPHNPHSFSLSNPVLEQAQVIANYPDLV